MSGSMRYEGAALVDLAQLPAIAILTVIVRPFACCVSFVRRIHAHAERSRASNRDSGARNPGKLWPKAQHR